MNIKYDVTGAGRKAFVKAVGEIMGRKPVYKGAPTFAFAIGNCIVNREGTLIFPDDVRHADIQQLADALRTRGYTLVNTEADDAPDFTDLQMTEREELGMGQQRCDPRGEDGMQASDVPEPETAYYDENPGSAQTADKSEDDRDATDQTSPEATAETYDRDKLVIEMPRAHFSDETIENLRKIIASKESLIKKALGADNLPVELTNDRVRFPWFTLPGPSIPDAYTYFICALCDMAKKQKRVIARERAVDNDKFTMRLFLIRLGFIGPQYKNARKALLQNLTGNSAWKDGQPPRRNVASGNGDSAGETPANTMPITDPDDTEVTTDEK